MNYRNELIKKEMNNKLENMTDNDLINLQALACAGVLLKHTNEALRKEELKRGIDATEFNKIFCEELKQIKTYKNNANGIFTKHSFARFIFSGCTCSAIQEIAVKEFRNLYGCDFKLKGAFSTLFLLQFFMWVLVDQFFCSGKFDFQEFKTIFIGLNLQNETL